MPANQPGGRSRAGRKSMWGERSPVSIKWPKAHRERYEREAALQGISLNEYVIRRMGELHGLIDPEATEAEPVQLRLGA